MKTSHLALLAVAVIAASPTILLGQVDTRWKQHDMNRPVPPVINPGTSSTQAEPGRPPSDATILFDGKDLSKWQHKDGTPAKWKVENGYAEIVHGTGYIYTKQSFGDCQLHVEFREPTPAHGESQERGNSGVFLMGLYEVQVLDSYENKTYADGQASALYGQYPPLVNASRPPGEWQWYDIVFHGPRFDPAGKLLRKAHVTVFHNGVLVQDNVELTGPTENGVRPPYKAHPEKLPLALQDHGDPVRFRNIWIRELN
ncbi:MAG: 3-keto-disaccharide hydrolase [Candidatus Acidiferrales bacterium]